MTWETGIRWADVAIIFATLPGPIFAVQAQKWLERRRVEKEHRLAIFRTLMATRAAVLSSEHVKGFAQPFSGKGALPMAVKEFPATADDETLASQAALQELLRETLEGNRTIKVELTQPNGD